MYRKEVNERSPLRVFERSIHGGLGRGNLGVVISRAGVGKTAFLVDIALDDLLRDRKVLHVAIGHSVEHARSFYNGAFQELARTTSLSEAAEVKLAVERARHIHSYQPGSFTPAKMCAEARFLRAHADFVPNTVVVDNFPFESASDEDLQTVVSLARELDAELWLSALSHRDTPTRTAGFPDPVVRFERFISVKLYLDSVGDSIRLRLLKDHENPDPGHLALELDPRTLLLKEGSRAV
ncbi:MAG: hypothetical protein EHM19_07505 [Candidatus Latescibacterota bacterium]|nr:MAG: hypothetical protein EHM19_07505 [Candidatus Latescibacterota bacterium]